MPAPEAPGSGPHWVKSSLSNSFSNCVEVAGLPDGRVAIRDSKNPDGPRLIVSWPAWREFVHDMKMGAPGYTRRLRGLWVE